MLAPGYGYVDPTSSITYEIPSRANRRDPCRIRVIAPGSLPRSGPRRANRLPHDPAAWV